MADDATPTSVEEPAESAPVESAPAAEPAAVEAAPDTSASPSTPTTESRPSADDFGWDDWDGEHESLPEEVRSWGQRVHDYHSSRHQAELARQKQELADHHNLYEALIAGREDPRVEQYQGQVKDWEHKHAILEAKYQTLEDDNKRFMDSINKSIEEEAERYAQSFQESNPDIFNSDALSDKFADLLEEGWGLEHAAEASRLPDSVLKIAKDAKANGVPDSYALKLARGTKMRTPQPRPGARITSGATTPSRSPEQVETTDTGAMSLKDWRKHVARNALNKNKTRRA